MVETSFNDLISIVVPTYNHENYIIACIDSIISQTYKNIELIIVNDGSTDSTGEAIESKIDDCNNRFTRFLYIDKENEGQIKTFNRGIFEATGSFISICASDDKFTPNSIETLYNFLKNNKQYGLVVGDNYFLNEKGEVVGLDINENPTTFEMDIRYFSFAELLAKKRFDVDFSSDSFGEYSSLLKGNYIPNGYLIRKNIFIDRINGYSDKAKLEDYYLMLQLAKYTKLKYLNEKIFYYRLHGSNLSKRKGRLAHCAYQTLLLERDYTYDHKLSKTFNEEILKLFNSKSFNILSIFKVKIIKTPYFSAYVFSLFSLIIFYRYNYINKKVYKIFRKRFFKK